MQETGRLKGRKGPWDRCPGSPPRQLQDCRSGGLIKAEGSHIGSLCLYGHNTNRKDWSAQSHERGPGNKVPAPRRHSHKTAGLEEPKAARQCVLLLDSRKTRVILSLKLRVSTVIWLEDWNGVTPVDTVYLHVGSYKTGVQLSLTGGLESRNLWTGCPRSQHDDSRKTWVLLSLNSHNGGLEGRKARGQSVLGPCTSTVVRLENWKRHVGRGQRVPARRQSFKDWEWFCLSTVLQLSGSGG